ncbi:MAG TPA: Holliday junction branch migration protein RuvA [Candidatus Cloacimonadota bacterium]|nr:Holliday junction branch migration protein RuvA [Candidatus Cloacimonadota bacterium]
MIFSLTGILKDKKPTSVIIETHGIAFELRIPLSTYEKLPERGQECVLHTHLYLSLNQDEMRLYGFATPAEKAVFIRLISISGIGPKIALSILSSLNVGMFIEAIQTAEEGLLAKVPGIGKKTAQRLIIELKDDVLQLSDYLETKERSALDINMAEVEKALTALGYSTKDIHKALPELTAEDKKLPIEHQIKKIIKIIYRQS